MEINDYVIGQWLKGKRLEKKYSTRYVAEKLGYSSGMPTLWENGKRSMSAKTFMDYCHLLGADPQEFIDSLGK